MRLLFVVLLLATPLPRAAAQDDGPSDTTVAQQDPEAARRAGEAFAAGIRQFRAREYREALHSFHVAVDLVPSADIWFNIARAHEELAEWEPSIEAYRRYLRDRVDPPDRAEVEARIGQLEERAEAARAAALTAPTTGTLTVRADRDGATVQLDGTEVGTTPLADDLTLSPGSHALLVTRPGYLPLRSEVAIEPGVRTAAYFDLQPETRHRAIRSDRIFTWVAWALAAVSVGFTVGLGVEASSRLGPDPAQLASARQWGAYSDYALAGAMALGTLGLALYFVEGQAVGTETLTTPEEGAAPDQDVRPAADAPASTGEAEAPATTP